MSEVSDTGFSLFGDPATVPTIRNREVRKKIVIEDNPSKEEAPDFEDREFFEDAEIVEDEPKVVENSVEVVTDEIEVEVEKPTADSPSPQEQPDFKTVSDDDSDFGSMVNADGLWKQLKKEADRIDLGGAGDAFEKLDESSSDYDEAEVIDEEALDFISMFLDEPQELSLIHI